MAAVRMRTRQTLGCVSNQLGRSPSDSNVSLFPDLSGGRVGFRGLLTESLLRSKLTAKIASPKKFAFAIVIVTKAAVTER